MANKTPLKRSIGKLDKAFSDFIRLRDTSPDGFGVCCTCGRTLPISKLDAGHFMSRRHMATRYNEQNVHAQCRWCNRMLHGCQYSHSLYIDRVHGEGTAEKLSILALHTKKYTAFELECELAIYREKVKQIKAERGL